MKDTSYLKKFAITEDDLELIKQLSLKEGLDSIDETEFDIFIEYFNEHQVFDNLIPILTDNNSDYWCLYIAGNLVGMVCYLSHEELSLEPKFISIARLLNVLNENPQAQGYYDLIDKFDFPNKNTINVLCNRVEIIENLIIEFTALEKSFKNKHSEFVQLDKALDLTNQVEIAKRNDLLSQVEELEMLQQQLAFTIIALTARSEIECNIYPFLNSEDKYIQERAIDIIAFHQYQPAKCKLIELSKTELVNRSAVISALEKLTD